VKLPSSGAQLFATLGTTGLDHVLAAFAGHAIEKAMLLAASGIVGLESALDHPVSLKKPLDKVKDLGFYTLPQPWSSEKPLRI
jgi:hypothetical protein